jgi:hypothetical protein
MNPQGATEDQFGAFRVDAVKKRRLAQGSRRERASNADSASLIASGFAGEVVVIVAIIVPFIAGRASVLSR